MNAVVASAHINDVFRANVRAVMEARGVSIRAMAKDLEFDYSGLHHFFSGRNGISLDRAARIAEYLELPLAELLSDEPAAAN